MTMIAIALWSFACNSTDPSDVTRMIQPGVGSSFTYEEVIIDTATGSEIDSTRDTIVHTVSEIGLQYMEKSNISRMLLGDVTKDLWYYVSSEDDGSVSYIWSGFGGSPSVWYRVPINGADMSFGSAYIGGGRRYTGPDTWEDFTLTKAIKMKRMGSGEETVQSKVFPVVLVNEERKTTETPDGGMSGYGRATTWSFAPTLGMPVRSEYSGSMNNDGHPTNFYSGRTRLISYSLK